MTTDMGHPARGGFDKARLEELISLCSDYEREIDDIGRHNRSTNPFENEDSDDLGPQSQPQTLVQQQGAISFYSSSNPIESNVSPSSPMVSTFGIQQNR